ncbi:catalase [Actinoalloteichus hoggarensis]|uniref:Catalase n=1 Tax=Actinoalloteichus hoggarensis TaxID=1470176 RepID=A0A221W326_9PSEU|nr:catalase [Actinoalloteichus hoggarensis]ASO20134.1 Catalase HPII [Actinoalloteichus hoggarensis]MBB5919153.1 catalase [Actinoalloteichus hoggarensis]
MAVSPEPEEHPVDPARGGDEKDADLASARVDPAGARLTTSQGVRVEHTDDSLTVGERGPTLLEDFHAREKITHFDHERIPERVVHARGAGAYGYFQPYDDSLADHTVAEFLRDPSIRTPVFVRFSTVAGSRGSADTVRDVRGFATRFYTRQGNYDLVGNNMPVFFIQDGIKFPDFVHAVKPEPHNEIPQAQSAHDTFWDFVGLHPESLHVVMWLMSDRSLPRSYRMMQGFGVHTFRLVDAAGVGTFVKFHWTPKLGTHSMIWEEYQRVAGNDPDFHRRDLWNAIEAGDHPEWELGVQLVPESDEFSFDFDLLDATKLIPEEIVPVLPVGRLVLDRNPDDFFAETEQIAFHTANLVPGIDFTNDPLLQARNFSYLDTQLIRLGGPNFSQLPVNRPITPVHDNLRDGYGQQRIHLGRAPYHKNSLDAGYPMVSSNAEGGFRHLQEKVEGHKIRTRSGSFADHHSQATLFWNSMSGWEREHIVAAFRFELGKCTDRQVRERVVEHLDRISRELAERVAPGIGIATPTGPPPRTHTDASPALSQENTVHDTVRTRTVAVLAADGVRGGLLRSLRSALTEMGMIVEVVAPQEGPLRAEENDEGHEDGPVVTADRALPTMASVLYDAVLVADGAESVDTLRADGGAVHFVAEAVRHAKTVGALGAGVQLLQTANLTGFRLAQPGEDLVSDQGVLTSGTTHDQTPTRFLTSFADSVAGHRVWTRNTTGLPA